MRTLRHVTIPMTDGTLLAARIWLHDGAESDPVPAVLEYVPYRKGDWYARGDSMMHPYFAGRGYAAVRVDLRGSGDSEGLLLDEYLPQEQEDACEVIAWLARQPWCSGRVGMIGFSWGGFAALQVAALRPPGLQAIIPCHSTHNRFVNDAHYLGGCVLGSEMLSWSTTMLAYLALPPDPDAVGEAWKGMWKARLGAVEPPVHAWLSHQRYDDYWRHGSPCESYEDIDCAVYAVGGTADPYVDSVPHLLQGLRCPKKGLIGPWAHYYPFGIDPGPQIGWLQECVRWWDYWLKDLDNGIMSEPALTVWMPDRVTPEPPPGTWPGRWIGLASWPPPDVSQQRLVLADGTLQRDDEGVGHGPSGEEGRPEQLQIVGNQAAGLDCGLWCPLGLPYDLPPDQRRDDGLSLTFTSSPLPEAIELLGCPTAVLSLSSDRPVALVAVRLCDVDPDGRSRLLTRGVLNLTHRESHSEPSPLVPGEDYEVRLPLRVTAASVPAGHRLRLAISPTYWPWAWPSPEPVRLTVSIGRSVLELPVYEGRRHEGDVRPFEAPDFAPPLPTTMVATSPSDWRVTRDVVSGRNDLRIRMAPLAGDTAAGRLRLLDSGLEIEELQDDHYSVVEDEPLSAGVICQRSCHMERGPWSVHVEVSSTLTSDAGSFRLTHRLEASAGHVVVFSRSWDRTVPRDLL